MNQLVREAERAFFPMGQPFVFPRPLACAQLSLWQFFFAALPAFASQGVDGKRVARLAFRDDVFGPFVAAAAIEARTAPSLLVALGVLLGYCAWVLPFEWKGVPHLVVSIFAVLQAVSHHQFLAASHPWGPLAPTPDATHMSTIMRLIYMALALAFWVLAVLSWSMAYAQQRAVASKKSE